MDPHWFWSGRSGIRIQEGKIDAHKNRKSEGISCFEVLDVLFFMAEGFPIAWTSFMDA
jgi:hypothetical protein